MRIPILAMIAVIALPAPALAQVAREPVEQKVPAPGATATPSPAPTDDRTPTSTDAQHNERAAPGEADQASTDPTSSSSVDQPVPTNAPAKRR